MYCPRCGAPNTDTTKFCRQCGLAMTPVTGYVATGGSRPLMPPAPPAPVQGEGLTPKQKMILTIVLLAMSPAICGVLAGVTGMGFLFGRLAALCAVLMPVGIVFAVFHFRRQIREWERQQQTQWQASMPPSRQPLPPAQSQPVSRPTPQPEFRPRTYQPPASPAPPTNPLGGSPGSVTEDETRRLP